MFGNLLNTEKMVTDAISKSITNIAKEYNCSPKEIWVMIKGIDEKGNFILYCYKGKELLRKMELDEII